MNLTFSLCAALPGAAETTASVSGDVLTIDGIAYDLSGVPEDGEAVPEGDHPFIGTITRTGGNIAATILWLYSGATAERGQGTEHPTATVASGTVPDPVSRI